MSRIDNNNNQPIIIHMMADGRLLPPGYKSAALNIAIATVAAIAFVGLAGSAGLVCAFGAAMIASGNLAGIGVLFAGAAILLMAQGALYFSIELGKEAHQLLHPEQSSSDSN